MLVTDPATTVVTQRIVSDLWLVHLNQVTRWQHNTPPEGKYILSRFKFHARAPKGCFLKAVLFAIANHSHVYIFKFVLSVQFSLSWRNSLNSIVVLARYVFMSSVIKTNASALREKNDRDLPRNSLNVNSKRLRVACVFLLARRMFNYSSDGRCRFVLKLAMRNQPKLPFRIKCIVFFVFVFRKHPLGALAWNLNRDKMYFPSGGVSCCQRVTWFKWTNQRSDTIRWVTTVVAGSVTSIFGKPNRRN